MRIRCSYDFTIGKKIIEFNGNYWHANPGIYEESKILTGGISALDKWKIDEEKIKLAESYGYEIMVVWESEFNENSEHIINKCLNFLI